MKTKCCLGARAGGPKDRSGKGGGTSRQRSGDGRYSRIGLGVILLGVALVLQPLHGAIRLNEIYPAANSTGLVDEDGQPSDWIEIHNPDAQPVNLAGYTLTDDPSDKGKWVFPSTSLPSGGYLVVYASGKDRRTGTNLHTNFKLSRSGEYLGLFSSAVATSPVSELAPAYPEQRSGYSYGRNSAGSWAYFQTATPRTENATSSVIEVCRPVNFNIDSGIYTSPFTLILTTPTPGALIRYTTDSTEPSSSNGIAYVGPVTISATRTVRAAAMKANALPSEIRSRFYLYNPTEALKSLPILSTIVDQDDLLGRYGIIGIKGGYYERIDGSFDSWRRSSPSDYFNPAELGIAWERRTDIELLPWQGEKGFRTSAGIRVHGSDSSRLTYHTDSKIPYNVFFRSDYGDAVLDYPLMPDSRVNRFDSLVLRAGHNDPYNPFLTDELMRRLFADTGQPSPLGMFVNHFINGSYQGYYNVTERVDEDWAQLWYGGTNTWDVMGPYNEAKEGDKVAWWETLDYVNAHSFTSAANYKEAERRLDVINFIDYLLVNIYGDTADWTENNWRASRERVADGQWRFHVWDAEISMGLFHSDPSHNNITEENELANGSAISTVFNKLRVNNDFKLLFADRVQKHFYNTGALSDENILRRFRELRQDLSGVIPQMINYLETDWVPQRRGYVMQHMAEVGLVSTVAAPNFNQHGGNVPANFQLTITAPAGTIYYNTTGKDPRNKYSSDVSSGSRTYSGPITLTQGTIVKARALVSGKWSALTEAEFKIARLGTSLRFTEINYNPPGGDAYEFVEIKNFGSTALDLSGYRIEGLDHSFDDGQSIDAGATIILAANSDAAAFANRYRGTSVFAYYAGKLSNGGERLTIRNAADEIVTSVTYDDENGWPTSPDGSGQTLEILDPLADPDDPANWRPSANLHGSPLSFPTIAAPIVRLNEVMAENVSSVSSGTTYPDWIELHRPSGGALDLSGWSLSDSGNPRKFVFPPGTSIASGGFLVVWCDALTEDAGLHTGFALDRESETVALFDRQTNRVDAISFGAQIADRSFGRVGNAWQLTLPTAGFANLPAPIAPAINLRINEWVANPTPGNDDWIEIYNRHATQPVALRGCYLTVGAVSYQIGSHSFISPQQHLRLWADENAGADHLNLKLPAGGSTIVLYDSAANQIDAVTYGAQIEGTSNGRLPDGGSTIAAFGSPTPSFPNSLGNFDGPVINEVLVRNRAGIVDSQGRRASWVELYNPTSAEFALAGMKLSTEPTKPNQWTFPDNVSISPNGYCLVWFDSARPVSVAAETDLNTGVSLNGNGGGVYLFAPSGLPVGRVEFGFQIVDRSIGRTGASNYWQLLNAPTPASANSATATLGTMTNLRINEWMSGGPESPDWCELYNSDSRPIALAGVALTDDLSLAGTNKFRFSPLTFIDGHGWIVCLADDSTGEGPNHASFRLNHEGEALRLYNPIGATLDTVYFGALSPSLSQGRFGDGQGNIIDLAPTPGVRNSHDSDGDGMPDTWESTYSLNQNSAADANSDSDGDGISNLNEYHTGTDPRDRASKLMVVSIVPDGGEIIIRVSVAPHRTYSLLSAIGLTGAWTKVKDLPAYPDATILGVSDALSTTTPLKIYRIEITSYP